MNNREQTKIADFMIFLGFNSEKARNIEKQLSKSRFDLTEKTLGLIAQRMGESLESVKEKFENFKVLGDSGKKEQLNQSLETIREENRELMLAFADRINFCICNKLDWMNDSEVDKIEAKLWENLSQAEKSGASFDEINFEWLKLYKGVTDDIEVLVGKFCQSRNISPALPQQFYIRCEWIRAMRMSKVYFAQNPSDLFFRFAFFVPVEGWLDFGSPVYFIDIDRNLNITF